MSKHDLVEQANQVLDNSFKNRSILPEKVVARLEREVAHGHDVQKWVKTLNPKASDELLVAALLHDVERIINLEHDSGFTGDRNSSAYADHKKQHALRSAAYVTEQLTTIGLPFAQIVRIALLITHHDDTGSEVEKINDPDLNTLVAADSFSFFTSIAPDMLAREGEARLADKVYFMVEKMPTFLRKLLQDQDFTEAQHGLIPAQAVIIERVKNNVLAQFIFDDSTRR